jgi:glycosyltransferase involved in cell wall biosynthesis
VMLRLKSEDDRIQIIDFSRNFGKEAATTAGLHFAKGDAAVLMDADLQHPAEILPAMIARWQDGFDVVLAKRRKRSKEPLLRHFLSLLYYRIHNRLSSLQLPECVGDFRLISRRVIDAVTRFMKGILTWVGFDSTVVLYEEGNRSNGQSKFNLHNLLNFALDGLFSFSTAPLRIWMYVGFSVGAASILYVLLILINVVIYGREVPGYASLMVSIGLIGGLNLIGIGALGEYLGRTFMESKKRPLYIVKDHYGNCRAPNGNPQSPQDAQH